jgi:DNA-binding CsgD family transcriptional regulator
MALRLQSGSAAFEHRLACASQLSPPQGQAAALRNGSARKALSTPAVCDGRLCDRYLKLKRASRVLPFFVRTQRDIAIVDWGAATSGVRWLGLLFPSGPLEFSCLRYFQSSSLQRTPVQALPQIHRISGSDDTKARDRLSGRDPGGCFSGCETSAERSKVFGFTASEARLACVMARGIPCSIAAQELNISRETVRNRLKSIFAKTNTHRQATLVAVLLRVE